MQVFYIQPFKWRLPLIAKINVIKDKNEIKLKKRPIRFRRRARWCIFQYGDRWVAESLSGQQIFARSRWQLKNTLDNFYQLY